MSRDGRVALALCAGSLLVLLVLSARSPLGPASSDYAALVNQAEQAVRGVARDGLGFFASAEGSHAVEQLTKRPLAPLLSAWVALSFGRVGLLDGSTCVRLPWLLLAALAAAGTFLMLRRRLPRSSAALGAIWLLASPGFAASALSVAPGALAAWAGWLVLGAAGSAASARTERERCAWSCASGGIALLGFGLSFATVWVVPLLLAHGWLARGRASLTASEHGALPVPPSALCVAIALPLGVVLFDPLLWHSPVPAVIRRVFEETDARSALGTGLGALALSLLLALSGAVALAHAALARRFATGEFRPKRDPSALGLELLLASVLCALAVPLDGDFAAQLLRPILACLVGFGAASVARRWFVRHAALAEAALLLASLLVR